MANKYGRHFLKRVKEIVEECGKKDNPRYAAELTAFAICVMIDGSGEDCGPENYILKTEEGEEVEFNHHEFENIMHHEFTNMMRRI